MTGIDLTPDPVGRAAADLAAFIDGLMPHWPLVGGAVVLVDRDGPLAEFGFGHADVEHGVAATTDHLFQIGSISKTFVSMVVNQLVDEGLIDLDEPITGILPWADLGAGVGPVTVRHLLSHTGGLILGGDGVPDDMAQLWGLRDLVRSPEATQHFHYSNLGFMLLGQAVRARTGIPLWQVMRQRVFLPTGMHVSLGRMLQHDRATMATGYWPTRDDIPWAPGDAVSPSVWFEIDAADGNVASSATDMGRFARLLLGSGEIDGVRVLSKEAIDRMRTPSAPGGEDVLALRGGPEVTGSRYGLGVNVETLDGHECLTHGGGMVGFQSFLLADRTAGVGVVVLTNANGCYPVAQLIARAGHQLLVAGRGAGAPAALPPAHDPFDQVDDAAEGTDDRLGDFSAPGVASGEKVTVSCDVDGHLSLSIGGRAGRLFRTWTSRYVTDHPALRDFRWDWSRDEVGPRWTFGPHVLRPSGSPAPASAPGPDPESAAVLGHYRSYSPWFPDFDVLWREGRAFLAAPGGVEAPEDDCELVREVAGWRIGADPWLPERLVAGPIVEGRAIMVLRDGVPYSRTAP